MARPGPIPFRSGSGVPVNPSGGPKSDRLGTHSGVLASRPGPLPELSVGAGENPARGTSPPQALWRYTGDRVRPAQAADPAAAAVGGSHAGGQSPGQETGRGR